MSDPEQASDGDVVLMSPADIMAGWRPGSYDPPWSWDDEERDLLASDDMGDLFEDINENGVFEPVLLGNDGWVWDGHHRIVIAHWLELPQIPAQVARSCEPPERWEQITGILIMDADGWRGRMADIPWTQPIDRTEFLRRAAMSTVTRWPTPLDDEPRAGVDGG